MAQLVVRNLDEETKTRLRRRAAEHGRSMEAEARDILAKAVGTRHGSIVDALRAAAVRHGGAGDLPISRRTEIQRPIPLE